MPIAWRQVHASISRLTRCELAIEKFGGNVQALIQKAEALNKRRINKAERDHQKRLDEEKHRREAQEAAEKARLDAIAERKRKALEKERAAEEQARDAESWSNLVRMIGQPNKDGQMVVDIPKFVQDAVSWRNFVRTSH